MVRRVRITASLADAAGTDMDKKRKSYTDRYTFGSWTNIRGPWSYTRTVKSVESTNPDWSVVLPVQPDQVDVSTSFSVAPGSYERVHTIEYDASPARTRDGVPVWKNCDHIVSGRDPLAMVYQPTPHIHWDVTSSVSWGLKEYFNYLPDSTTVIRTVYDDFTTINWWDALDYDEVRYNRNPIGVTPTSLGEALSLLSDDEINRYSDWGAGMFNRFKNLTDLNRMVDSDQMFYSNLMQTVFPLGRLLAGKRLIHGAAQWLSQWRAKFSKRPFLTALTEIGKTDLFYRFVIETTIRDALDLLSSFNDVVKVFETANGANSRPWTRLALNDRFNADISIIGEKRIKIEVPGRPVHRGPGTSQCSVTYEPRGATASSWAGRQHHSAVTTPRYRDVIDSGYDTYYPPSLQAAFREINTSGYWTTSYGLSLHRRIQRWAKVRYHNLGSLSPLKVWQNRVGITKPLTSLWDMVPFSFVLDYFFRIGDWIEGISQYSSDAWQLRGQVIDAGPVWQCDKWEYGLDVRSNALSQKGLEETGVQGITLVLPSTTPLCDVVGFHRHPITGMEESFRFGILSDKDLNATRQRTLVELGLNLVDRSLAKGDRSAEETRRAITTMQLRAKGWRTPNRAIDNMSTDMFSDYLKRTLSQAEHTLKQRKH
jgi:hypothetical protein